MKKRIMSLVLCFVMLVAMTAIAAPLSATADGEENTVSIELPYRLTVKKTGEMDPGMETFKFSIGDFGAQSEYTVVKDTIETYGEMTYNGTYTFTIDRSLCGNLSEGFVFRQVKGDAEGWAYDETGYYAVPIFSDNYDRVAGWSFFKLDGNGRYDQSNAVEEITFTNGYAASRPPEGTIRIELPYKLNVKKTGEAEPGKEAFKFMIGDFGAASDYSIVQDTIETDGEKTYDGMFVFTISDREPWNLTEGFVFRQVKGNAEGWTYDETEYYVIPKFDDNFSRVSSWTVFKLDGDRRPDQENMVEELILTNSYYAKKPVEPPKPEPSDYAPPKTGDGTAAVIWIVLMLASGAVFTGVALYSRKKTDSR